MKINIENATASQLAKFASVKFGIDVAHTKGRDHILGLLANVGFTGSEIDVDEPAAAPKAQPAKPIDTAGRKKLRIIIQTQDAMNGGNHPVVVGVNGTVARIKRGEPVDVPVEYVEALRNANRVAFDKGPNGEPINPHLVPTHPFTVIGAVA